MKLKKRNAGLFLLMGAFSQMVSANTESTKKILPIPQVSSSPTALSSLTAEIKKNANIVATDFSVREVPTVAENFLATKKDPADEDKTFIEEVTWDLYLHGKKVGELESIGGAPSIESVTVLARPDGKRFLFLTYDAGSAGTKSISNVDRALVLLETDKNSDKWVIALDFMLGLTRYAGEKTLHQFVRKYEWNKDHSTISLEAIDDYPAEKYSWNGEKLTNK